MSIVLVKLGIALVLFMIAYSGGYLATRLPTTEPRFFAAAPVFLTIVPDERAAASR